MNALDPRRLQQHLRDGLRRHARATRAGPFTCYLNPETSDGSLNVAIPDEPSEGRRVPVMGQEAEGLSAVPNDDAELGLVLLKAHFSGNHRTPRVDFIDVCHPELPKVLEAHGFREATAIPVLASTRATWKQVDPPMGLRVEPILEATSWDVVKRYLEVQREAFDIDMEIPLEGPKGYWPALQLGAGLYAEIDGEPAGAGGITPVDEGLADVRGLAVRPSSRGKGVGSFLLSALARVAHETGVEALLAIPDDQTTLRMARRAGFVPAATIRSFTAEVA